MKIQYFFSLLVFAGLMFTTSCKNETKTTVTKESETKSNDSGLKLIKDATTVEWTAYKTTAKVPVKGNFSKIHFEELGEGNTVAEAMNNARFTIDAFSLLTGDPDRDTTIRNAFFRMMNPAGTLSGQFLNEGDDWFANIRMNDVTFKVPVEMNIGDKRADVSATIDLKDFDVMRALTSLNEACGDLHKGEDGVSKTWEDVAVTGSVEFQ